LLAFCIKEQKEIARVGTISANNDAFIGNITTEAMVAEKPQKEAPMPPMGGGMPGMY
jgi:hypothetical protein